MPFSTGALQVCKICPFLEGRKVAAGLEREIGCLQTARRSSSSRPRDRGVSGGTFNDWNLSEPDATGGQ